MSLQLLRNLFGNLCLFQTPSCSKTEHVHGSCIPPMISVFLSFFKKMWSISLWCTALSSLTYFVDVKIFNLLLFISLCTFSLINNFITWEIKQTYLSISNFLISKMPVEDFDFTQANRACKAGNKGFTNRHKLIIPLISWQYVS